MMANHALFYPLKYPAGFWEIQRECSAQDVRLRTADGVGLHAWWFPREHAGVATLFLHGNAANITYRGPHIREIVGAGSALLLPDYRGFGKSEGSPSEPGLYADADAAYDYLLAAGYTPDRIVLHGESLGTAVAVDLASRRPCAGLILEAPFTSVTELAGRILPLLGPMFVSGFDSGKKIGSVRAQLLFVHGNRDELVPNDLGRALFRMAPDPKSFWEVTGAGHNNLISVAGAAYGERLRRFYATCRSTCRR